MILAIHELCYFQSGKIMLWEPLSIHSKGAQAFLPVSFEQTRLKADEGCLPSIQEDIFESHGNPLI